MAESQNKGGVVILVKNYIRVSVRYRLDGRTVNVRASCAGGLGFNWTGQILHSVANGSPPLQHLRQVAVLP